MCDFKLIMMVSNLIRFDFLHIFIIRWLIEKCFYVLNLKIIFVLDLRLNFNYLKYIWLMSKVLGNILISLALGGAPLSSANAFGTNSNNMNGVRTELSEAMQSNEVKESFEVVDANIVVNAIMNYFDEDVKKFKLSSKARTEVKSILISYFSSHSFFIVNDWNVEFYIDDKKEFSKMIKGVINVVIEDMPFLVRKVVIPLFLWWNDAIQRKLDNLEGTVYNMKEKQYKEIIFDCVAWITKKVCNNINWKTTIGEYYKSISKYFPNKNWNHILQELNTSGQSNIDIKRYKFKK